MLSGMDVVVVKVFVEVLEVVLYILVENVGLNLIEIVIELCNVYVVGNVYYGINVRKGMIFNMKEENVF